MMSPRYAVSFRDDRNETLVPARLTEHKHSQLGDSPGDHAEIPWLPILLYKFKHAIMSAAIYNQLQNCHVQQVFLDIHLFLQIFSKMVLYYQETTYTINVLFFAYIFQCDSSLL